MGMSNKMKTELAIKRETVKAILEAMGTAGISAEITGDGAFGMVIKVDGEDRVLNFVGTMKKNALDGVAITADEVLDNLIIEFMDKVDEREKSEKIAEEKKALKEAEVAAKKVLKEKEKEAKAAKAEKAKVAVETE